MPPRKCHRIRRRAGLKAHDRTRAALGGANFVAVAVLACCQMAAYVYYLLSYIPYGRKGAQKLASAAMK